MRLSFKRSHDVRLAFLLPLLLFSCKVRKLTPPAQQITFQAPINFRVVGYLLGGEIAKGQSAKFDISRLNYLNVFFNGQDANHKLRQIPHLDSVIDAAHRQHVKVLACIGNATDSLLLMDSSRAGFIDSLVTSVVAQHLDGIDVDLEGGSIDANYEAFVHDLSSALKLKGKLITAAVATWESPRFTDKALSYFDFLNVMTYDATGPWNLKRRGPHSPYSMAVSDLDFWTHTRGIPKDKLNLGLPFYGYGFGPNIKQEFNYREIVNMYPGAEDTDQVTATPGNVIYYNGIPTMIMKTKFALQNAGGVMIWEVMQDAAGEKSLLNAVDKAIAEGTR